MTRRVFRAGWAAGLLCGASVSLGAGFVGGWAEQKPASKPDDVWSWPDTGREQRFRFKGYHAWFVGGDLIPLDRGCAGFDAFFLPWAFFYPLKRFDTPRGPVFRIAKRVVTEFPDEITLDILVGFSKCSEQDKSPLRWGPVPPDFLRAPRAQGLRIRGLEQRPIEISLKGEGVRGWDAPGLSQYWAYTFVAKTKGIPLTDVLVFTLYSRDGRKLSHFALRL